MPLKEIKRYPGEMRKTNLVNCISCGGTIPLDWNQGNLDSAECCGLHYSLDYPGVDIVIEREIPETFPGVILWHDTMSGNITLYCGQDCAAKAHDFYRHIYPMIIDVPIDKIDDQHRCGKCGKNLK